MSSIGTFVFEFESESIRDPDILVKVEINPAELFPEFKTFNSKPLDQST